uniref:Cupin type-1 domain-containing protein n=1 Tax=Cucumis sativus TaxID=3659 RepID=A0A0A0KA23_CUCSA
MVQNMKAMNPRKYFQGVGGSYNKWYPSDYPLLAQSKVRAGMLLLHPRGFAILHYSDASKVGYVLQGNNGVTGFIFPNTSNEQVIKLQKGDLIPVPAGVTSWCQQNGLIFKLQKGQTLTTPTKATKFIYNLDNNESIMKVSEFEFPFIGETGLAVVVDRLGPNVVRSPVLLVSPAAQLIYVAGGSGTFQIVGLPSSSKTEVHVESGQLVFVPKHFAVGKIAAEQGMEYFSILTTKM